MLLKFLSYDTLYLVSQTDMIDFESNIYANHQKGDLHTHVESGDSLINLLFPKKVIETAVQKDLSIVAVTDHISDSAVDKMRRLAAEYIGSLGRPYHLHIARGAELYIRSPLRSLSIFGMPTVRLRPHVPHALALGMRPVERILKLPKIEDASEWVQENGGVIIVPHPKEEENWQSYHPEQIIYLAERHIIQGVETSTEGRMLPDIEILARKVGIAETGDRMDIDIT